MATRTVRLDRETERVLSEVRAATGYALSSSANVRGGVRQALKRKLGQ